MLQSLCVYYDIYGYTTISMGVLQSRLVRYYLLYTTISMGILQSLCVFHNLYVYTTISMRKPRSLWLAPIEKLKKSLGCVLFIDSKEVSEHAKNRLPSHLTSLS